MKKQIVKKVSNQKELKGAENTMKKTNMEVLKDFAGTTKKTIEAIDTKDLKPLEKHIMELVKKEAKNIDKTFNNKINVRINWIEAILESKENELLEDIVGDSKEASGAQEIAVTTDKTTKKLDSVASPKKTVHNHKKITQESAEIMKNKKEPQKQPQGDKKDTTGVNTPTPQKEAKIEANKGKKAPDKKVTSIEAKNIPEIAPESKYYIELETEQEFQVIYINRDKESVVLLNDDGVIEADSKKFDKGILFYFIGNKNYCYDITRAYMK